MGAEQSEPEPEFDRSMGQWWVGKRVLAKVEGKWYAGSFPADVFITPFDAGARTDSVGRLDETGLYLHGLASREENPPEGQTLLVYDPPITVLQFPIRPGSSYESTGAILNGTLRGIPYAGSDTYEVVVDATG